MARSPRSHLPGAVFHLTARTQGQAPWFRESLRSRIAEYTAAAIRVSDARLLAYAIMPNHLHLIVRQGAWPLGRVMQPLLLRTAVLVQRAHGIQGHVFERRFADQPCLDPDHVRNGIVYAHLNPVRAGMVGQPSDYPWSSHGLYAAADAEPRCMIEVLAVEYGLALFAPRDGLHLDELRRAYGRHLEWRLERDRHREAEALGHDVGPPPPRPPVLSGDMCWSRTCAPLFRPYQQATPADDGPPPAPRRDLGDLAKDTHARLAPDIPLEQVRSSYKGRAVVAVRRAMIRRMRDAGHGGRAIARYLRVSDQCVSNVVTAARRASFGPT